jgi:16S rRNA G527 N7-methylase RsmG
LDKLFAYAQPLLRRNGLLVSIKGSAIQQEIGQLQSAFGKQDIEVRGLPGRPCPVSRNLKVVFVRSTHEHI